MMMSPLLDHYQDEVLSHMLADYQYVLKAPVPTETDGAEAYLAGSLKTMPTEFSSEEVSVYGVEKTVLMLTLISQKKVSTFRIVMQKNTGLQKAILLS